MSVVAPWSEIQTLVFDFDGTLATCPYDFVRMRHAVTRVALEHGIDPECFGAEVGLLEAVELGARVLGHDLSRAGAFREAAMASLCAIEYEAAGDTVLLPGIVETLQALDARGYRLGVVTRNSSAAVKRILGDTPLPVHAVLCREDVRTPKPHPDHVERMLALLDSHPLQSLMIGDHPMDIETGKAVGMGTVAVLTGQTDELTLRSAEPDMLFPSVVELAAVLLRARDGA